MTAFLRVTAVGLVKMRDLLVQRGVVVDDDDQVDAMTQALRWLYPLFNRLKVTQEAINKAMGKR